MFLSLIYLITYLGSKRDLWIAIDPITGAKVQTLSSNGAQKVCPSSSENLLYIGRTGECNPSRNWGVRDAAF